MNAFARVGAFPFKPDSRDATLVVSSDPGAYSVHLAAADGSDGIGLIEIYDVEWNEANPGITFETSG